MGPRQPDEARDVFIDAALAFLAGRAPAAGRNKVRAKGGKMARDDLPRAEAIGIRMVSDLAGRDPSTLLFHFPDRESLVAAIASRGFRQVAAHIDAAPEHGRIRVLWLAERYAEWGIRNPGLFTVMYDPSLARGLELAQLGQGELERELRKESPALAAGKRVRAFMELFEAKRATLEIFTGALRTDQAQGLVKPVDTFRAAHAMAALADGLVWQWITERQGEEPGMVDHARQCIRILVEGLVP